jgi:hypothetical protein
MAYAGQPFLFRDGAIDAFHEAIGDTVALSVTPPYLKQLSLIDQVPDPSADMGFLLQRALDKVAFLPFGYLVDQWRWKVFSGEVGPNDYNKAWWELREKYQGITCRRTHRTRVTSWRRFCSFNFTARCVAKPDSTARFISVRSTETSVRARS